MIRVTAEVPVVATSRRQVERLAVAPELSRALLPLETYPVSAGIKGGLAGSVAMAVLACLYGLLKQGSIWYPINLLAATAYSEFLRFGTASLDTFHLGSFSIAVVIHLLTSLLVGLLVRSHAADVSTPSDSSGGDHRADSLDRFALQYS